MTSFPPVSSQGINMVPMPEILTIGTGVRRLQPRSIVQPSTVKFPNHSQWLWVRGTPLGMASVPDVQQIVNRSLAETVFAASYSRIIASFSGVFNMPVRDL